MFRLIKTSLADRDFPTKHHYKFKKITFYDSIELDIQIKIYLLLYIFIIFFSCEHGKKA